MWTPTCFDRDINKLPFNPEVFYLQKPHHWIVFRCFCHSPLSFPHTNTHPLINSIGIFIAQSRDRKHIVPYLLGLVACSAWIIASFWVEAAVQALWMNWVSARGWEMALIPLWCHSRDKEKRGSFMKPPIHLSVSSLSPCPPPPPPPYFSCPVMGSYYRLVTHPRPQLKSPLTHPRCSLAIFPNPVLPCPAVPVPAQ